MFQNSLNVPIPWQLVPIDIPHSKLNRNYRSLLPDLTDEVLLMDKLVEQVKEDVGASFVPHVIRVSGNVV